MNNPNWFKDLFIDEAKNAISDKDTGGGGNNADWNQNDSTKPGYVQNRPFYTDGPVETVIFEERTVEVEGNLSPYVNLTDLDTPFDGTIVEGETYIVHFNGVRYECVAWRSTDDEDDVIVGNGAIYGGDGGNGEPFSLEYDGSDFYLNVAEAGNYMLSIAHKTEVVHTIDPKYLPQPDLVITVNSRPSNTSITKDMLQVVTGSCEAVIAALRAGKIPDVRIRYIRESGYWLTAFEITATVEMYEDSLYISWIVSGSVGASRIVKVLLAFYSGELIVSTTGYAATN